MAKKRLFLPLILILIFALSIFFSAQSSGQLEDEWAEQVTEEVLEEIKQMPEYERMKEAEKRMNELDEQIKAVKAQIDALPPDVPPGTKERLQAQYNQVEIAWKQAKAEYESAKAQFDIAKASAAAREAMPAISPEGEGLRLFVPRLGQWVTRTIDAIREKIPLIPKRELPAFPEHVEGQGYSMTIYDQGINVIPFTAEGVPVLEQEKSLPLGGVAALSAGAKIPQGPPNPILSQGQSSSHQMNVKREDKGTLTATVVPEEKLPECIQGICIVSPPKDSVVSGKEHIVLHITTEKPAKCQYNKDVDFSFDQGTFFLTDLVGIQTFHKENLFYLEKGDHTYYYKCKDETGEITSATHHFIIGQGLEVYLAPADQETGGVQEMEITDSFRINVNAGEETPVGKQETSVKLKRNGEDVGEIALSADVVSQEQWQELAAPKEFPWLFVITTIIIIIAGILFGFRIIKRRKEKIMPPPPAPAVPTPPAPAPPTPPPEQPILPSPTYPTVAEQQAQQTRSQSKQSLRKNFR